MQQLTNEQFIKQYTIQAILISLIAMGVLGLSLYLILDSIQYIIIASFAGVWTIVAGFSMWRRSKYDSLVEAQALDDKERKNEEGKMRGAVSLVVVLLAALLLFTYDQLITYFSVNTDALGTIAWSWGVISVLLLGVGVWINKK